MSRDDLLATNARIVGAVAAEIKQTSPEAVVIVVSNPLDAMVQRAWQVTGFPPQRVIGPGRRARYGPLPHLHRRWNWASASRTSRPCSWAATATRWCRCRAAPAWAASPSRQLIRPSGWTRSIQRTRDGGAEIVALLKTGSAYYAPAAATAQMVEAIVRDKKRLIPCAAYCDKEYGVGGYYVGVPVILGAGGVERIIELELTAEEQAAFQKSVDAVKGLVETMDRLTAAPATA